ncbi:MAG: inner-rane translocator, partial [Thermoleophilia bacterium]|nr:inner-rane translocator [Thermoleophilia bacterium]
ITPESILPIVTFLTFVIVIMGGIGSISGTIVGALLLQTLIEGTRDLDIGMSEPREAALRYVIVGAVLMLLIAVRPQGLFGNKREMHLE